MKTDFHNKDFALSLALKWRLRWTRKWPITTLWNHALFLYITCMKRICNLGHYYGFISIPSVPRLSRAYSTFYSSFISLLLFKMFWTSTFGLQTTNLFLCMYIDSMHYEVGTCTEMLPPSLLFCSLKLISWTPQIPDAVTAYYLNRSGFDSSDPRV